MIHVDYYYMRNQVEAALSDKREIERRNTQLEAALANQHRVLEHAALLLELASSTYATHAQRNGMNMLISEYLKRFQHSRNAAVIPPVEMVDDIPF